MQTENKVKTDYAPIAKKAADKLDWPTTGQFLGALSALGILLLILGVINLWFLLHADVNSWLHLANSVLLLGGVCCCHLPFILPGATCSDHYRVTSLGKPDARGQTGRTFAKSPPA